MIRRSPSIRELRARPAENVAILPTAAPRQVCNSRFADQRKASIKARRVSPFRDRYIAPQDRRAREFAAELMEVGRTPELIISAAIFRTLTAEQK